MQKGRSPRSAAARCTTPGWASGIGRLQLQLRGRQPGTGVATLTSGNPQHSVECTPLHLSSALLRTFPSALLSTLPSALLSTVLGGQADEGGPARGGATVSLTLTAKKKYWQRQREKKMQEQAAAAAEPAEHSESVQQLEAGPAAGGLAPAGSQAAAPAPVERPAKRRPRRLPAPPEPPAPEPEPEPEPVVEYVTFR